MPLVLLFEGGRDLDGCERAAATLELVLPYGRQGPEMLHKIGRRLGVGADVGHDRV